MLRTGTSLYLAALVVTACQSGIDLLPLDANPRDSGLDSFDAHGDTPFDINSENAMDANGDIGRADTNDSDLPDRATDFGTDNNEDTFTDQLQSDVALEGSVEADAPVIVSQCLTEMITCPNTDATCVDVWFGVQCFCNDGLLGDGDTCFPGRWGRADDFVRANNPDEGDAFGTSMVLSADGSTLVIGAPFEDSSGSGSGAQQDNAAPNSGAVYVYVRTQAGWVLEEYIKAANAGPGDRFGWSVALSGNFLAVGAPREDSSTRDVFDNSLADSGAVYIYERLSDGWRYRAFLKASTPDSDDQFGYSVAFGDNVVAVGAPFEDGSGDGLGPVHNNQAAESGAVYLFRSTAGQWDLGSTLKSPHSTEGDHFGWQVSLSASGQTLAVGAPHDDHNLPNQTPSTIEDSGSVFLYQSLNGDPFQQTAMIKSDVPHVTDGFGSAVALTAGGETIAVGAPYEDSGSLGRFASTATDSGVVFIFQNFTGTWTLEILLKSPHPIPDQQFGSSVAISALGETLVVGSPNEASLALGINPMGNRDAPSSGAAWVFDGSIGGWNATHFLKAFNTGANDRLGSSVAISGDGYSIAAGAPGEDSSTSAINGQPDDALSESGSAYTWSI